MDNPKALKLEYNVGCLKTALYGLLNLLKAKRVFI